MGGRVTGRGGWSHNRLWKGEANISASEDGITIVYSVAVYILHILITSTASAITQSVFLIHGLNRPVLNPTPHLYLMPRSRKLETVSPLSYVF